jgi:DNA-binding transcriptional ArsR family regulator
MYFNGLPASSPHIDKRLLMFPVKSHEAPPIPPESEFVVCAERLKALSEPIRLRITAFLISGPKTVSEIATALDEDIVKISHHLSVLRHGRILSAAKKGRHVEYVLDPEIIHLGSNMLGGQIDFGNCSVRIEQIEKQLNGS